MYTVWTRPTKDRINRQTTNAKAVKLFLNKKFEPFEIARSLLAFDLKLFQKIIPWHLLGGIYSKKNSYCTVRPCIEQFNTLESIIHGWYIIHVYFSKLYSMKFAALIALNRSKHPE